MARTVAEAVRLVRTTIQDVLPPQRWGDQVIADALIGAFEEARRLRPDLFIGANATLTMSSDPAFLFERTWPLAAFTFMPIVNMAVGIVESADDQSVVDERAKLWRAMATAQLMGSA